MGADFGAEMARRTFPEMGSHSQHWAYLETEQILAIGMQLPLEYINLDSKHDT